MGDSEWQVLTAWWSLVVPWRPGEDGVPRALWHDPYRAEDASAFPPPTKDAARDQHCLLCPAMSRCFGHSAPTPSHTSSSAVVAPVTRDPRGPSCHWHRFLDPSWRSPRHSCRPAASSSYPTAKSYLAINVSFQSLVGPSDWLTVCIPCEVKARSRFKWSY